MRAGRTLHRFLGYKDTSVLILGLPLLEFA